MAVATGKRPRKAYTITRPREKWTGDEHERFLHALQLFGRDWKTVEQFVATKTATRIRSHAQKHFLRTQKLGLAATATWGMAPVSGVQLACTSVGASWPCHGSFMESPNCSDEQAGASPWAAWFADALLPDEATHLPLLPGDPRFAHVYRFIGDVFGSGEPLLDEQSSSCRYCIAWTLSSRRRSCWCSWTSKSAYLLRTRE
ncbi:hypothetical protein EJB05_08063, partial [Eragrostis curvula]